ncbi:Sensor histidine kinase WalK [bioreactor metagenome]|uniref:histidine kinase n=1 Tax=bioreactor metagenome TaxID=1076179 RepID=A0A645GV05_9ZZZZ
MLENLIVNALKYSLAGSRIFIDLVQQGDLVIFAIKNTANYEMDFDEEEILQRFARGDKTRSSEGSGLGLAIAQSFTEACGGFFNIGIDGDQFRASVTFCKIPPEEIESDETNQQDADIAISELPAKKEALDQ